MTGTILAAWLHAGQEPPGGLVHTRVPFTFTLSAPPERVLPLFGAEGERAWAGSEWDPRFLYPETPRDVPGMVFTTDHGGHHATWVNTAYDLPAGHIQYVSLVAGALVTTVDVRVVPAQAGSLVTVVYERTALRPELNEKVKGLGGSDPASLREWPAAIEACLAQKSSLAGR
jgi:hypothetical protein